MMGSPFFGISVFIHVPVIVFHRVSDMVPGAEKLRARGIPAVPWAGAAIIAGISWVLFVAAGQIVYTSATEEHSNLFLLRSSMQETGRLIDIVTPHALGATPEAINGDECEAPPSLPHD
jgi:hypothetical protein